MSASPATVAEVLLPYTCTGCGKQKGEANHWFVVWTALHPIARGDSIEAVMHAPWILEIAAKPWAAVACGEACLHKLISRYLSNGLFTAPRSKPDVSPEPEKESPCPSS